MRRALAASAAAMLLAVSSASAQANDFPTSARVEFVFGCMNQRGGPTYDNLYQCSCAVDQIAQRMSYLDYSEAETYAMLRRTAGERGGVFRDPPRARKMVTALESAQVAAEKACFVTGSPVAQGQ